MTRRAGERPRVGLSTGCVGGAPDVAGLVRAGCEVVELVGLDGDGWARVAPSVAGAAVPVGLHCPIPYDGVLRRFDITAPDPAARAVAMELVERTLEAAVRSAAAYVVVHFPSPHPHPGPGARTAAARPRRDAVLRLGEELARAQCRTGVPVRVENLSHHPDFGSAEDYVALFTEFPNLRMCLDLGHAWVSGLVPDLAGFVAATAAFVDSAHVYTTRRSGPDTGRHEPAGDGRVPQDGWLDVRAVLAELAARSPVEDLVLEYAASRAGDGDPARALAWTRAIVEDLTWA